MCVYVRNMQTVIQALSLLKDHSYCEILIYVIFSNLFVANWVTKYIELKV
jgi:hypothetical protein